MPAAPDREDSAAFPRQSARTRRFTLGVPRDITISEDGMRVGFLRTRSGDDPVTCLWLLDIATGIERMLVDPSSLDAAGDLPPEERARRERSREASNGIVRYSADGALRRAVFDLNGALHAVDVRSGAVRRLPAHEPIVDPRLDPTGERVAYVSGGALHVIGIDGGGDRLLAEPEHEQVTYGLAEFVAAEEMDRQQGFWWSPDGTRLLVSRVDVTPVQRWYIADPAEPARAPQPVAYPNAGSANAIVSLLLVRTAGGHVSVRWDDERFEYVVAVDWSRAALRVVVQTRDQRTMRVLRVDTDTGDTALEREERDGDWVDVVRGVPAHLDDGTLVWTADIGGAKRLIVGKEAVTDGRVEVREVHDVDGDTVLFSASVDPTSVAVWTWSRASGAHPVDAGGAATSAGRRRGGTTVVARTSLAVPDVQVTVHRDQDLVARIASVAEAPLVTPAARMLELGERRLRAALLLPTGHTPGSGALPVLLDPYGGPGHQRVVTSHNAFLESQWFADQGFAVLVIDGRGTPGRGPAWARSIRGDIAGPVLEDQVDGLHAAAAKFADLDLSRVAIRGWSFGGYLAALAVLRRPDVFHAAVAGAPVTEQTLYDTHYTERYLGHPAREPDNYARASLIEDAPNLTRPLLLIHGLVDDNVVVAHTLRLSAALFAAGRPHTLLPLPGVTHSTNREDVAAVLPLLQLRFLQEALGLAVS